MCLPHIFLYISIFLNYAFEGFYSDDISYINILESLYEVVYEIGFIFIILYNSMSFLLDKLFLNYDIDSERSVI